MFQSSIFQWPEGTGWIVLSSGGNFLEGETEAIDSRMLTQSAADGPLVCIGAANDADTTEQYLRYLTDLGGRTSYPVDIIAEDDISLNAHLSNAGIIVIGDGPNDENLYNGLHGAAIQAIRLAYEHGALIMGIGIGAEVMGQWLVRSSLKDTRPGFGWLTNSAILSGVPTDGDKQLLQGLLEDQPTAYGLGIRPRSAMAFGPGGHVELWGQQQIAISLGKSYSIREE